jgi:hypothetical protein
MEPEVLVWAAVDDLAAGKLATGHDVAQLFEDAFGLLGVGIAVGDTHVRHEVISRIGQREVEELQLVQRIP